MSVTARLNRLKDLRVVATDALRLGSETAGRAVRAATPHVSAAAGAVRARLGRGEPPTPTPSAPAPSPTPTAPVEATTSARKPGPSPATVARNIPPHPPEPPAKPARTVPKASPSGKLPPRRRSDDD